MSTTTSAAPRTCSPSLRDRNRPLPERSIPPHVASRRLIIASVMLYHGLADYSHVLEASEALNDANVQMFTADLEAMMVAALVAPFDKSEDDNVQ